MVGNTAPVGVLAFQGDFQKHIELLTAMGRRAVAVREPADVDDLGALVIPGGESTTIGMLMDRFGLMEPVRTRVRDGMPVLGTCAGAILLAREIEGSAQPRIGVLDVTVRRNAYGRQVESFEADLELAEPVGEPDRTDRADRTDRPGAHRSLRAVFIRAPIITRVGAGVEVLARFEDDPVVVRQGSVTAATFHPELSGETVVHRLFLENGAVRG
ncbi:MAG: pyridoxal 5'-phosphate synthase glutaminase subunit PdxT [Spirochaetaceae bacterium]